MFWRSSFWLFSDEHWSNYNGSFSCKIFADRFDSSDFYSLTCWVLLDLNFSLAHNIRQLNSGGRSLRLNVNLDFRDKNNPVLLFKYWWWSVITFNDVIWSNFSNFFQKFVAVVAYSLFLKHVARNLSNFSSLVSTIAQLLLANFQQCPSLNFVLMFVIRSPSLFVSLYKYWLNALEQSLRQLM